MTLRRNDEPVTIPPDRFDSLVSSEGLATERFFTLLEVLSERVPIYSTGNPNGQFPANEGRLYVDIEGAQGSRVFMKTTNGGNSGWEPI